MDKQSKQNLPPIDDMSKYHLWSLREKQLFLSKNYSETKIRRDDDVQYNCGSWFYWAEM